MTTLLQDAPKSKAKAFACSLTAEINGQPYGVEPIDPGECGTKAYRLTKRWADGAVYDVIREDDGHVACDCPDYEARHRGNGFGMCKHGRSLVTLGLLDAPKAPEPAARPFAAGVPSDRDRAASRAFGIKLPARAEAPAPSAPRDVTDALIACLACPDCEGLGCPSCVDTPADGPTVYGCRPVGADRSDQLPHCVPVGADRPTSVQPRESGEADAPSEAAGEPESFADDLADATTSEGTTGHRGGREGDGRLTLAEWVRGEVERFRKLDHAAADLLADALAEVARRIEYVNARSVHELESRWAVVEAPAA